jgi:hypothetical protein
MGREVRRVPANWEHPRDDKGSYIPLFGDSFSERAAKWDEENAKWTEGLRQDWKTKDWIPLENDEREMTFEEWDGPRPVKEDYMPDWPESGRTHYQMYESTTEGTPISPVMSTPEELARWLADTNASAFGGQGASYEAWLKVCRGGWAPSAVMANGVMTSGVEAMAALAEKE